MNGNKQRSFNNTNTSSGGKNPYELRTELLNLAYQICYNQHVSDEVQDYFDAEDEDVEFMGVPKTSPTTAEVIECATQLNDFISQKSFGGGGY